MKKSPVGAVIRSAVVPGLGQIYNEAYWKIPIIWGFLAFNVSKYIEWNNSYKSYKDEIIIYKNNITKKNTAIRRRDIARNNRDSFAVWILVTYLLNLVDAYVDAHMFDFDVSPNPITQTISARLTFRIGL